MDSLLPPQDASDPAKPKGIWATVLTTLPVVLTVLATAFAGMSSSEMTQAMYYRSLAAEQQAKAGDQWAYFQAKRIRGTTLESSAELLQSLGNPAPFDLDQLTAAVARLRKRLDTDKQPSESNALMAVEEKLMALVSDTSAARSLTALRTATLPAPSIPPINSGVLVNLRSEPDATREQIRKWPPEAIDQELRAAENSAASFDNAIAPASKLANQLREAVKPLPALLRSFNRSEFAAAIEAVESQEKGFRMVVMEFDAKRYRKEADYNRDIAEIHEMRVFRSGVESDRHRERSKMFFYSMLVAQAGVTIASLALARQQRKSLWLMAALAGLIALGLSTWVYLSF